MKKSEEKLKEYTLDARGRKLGRLATEIATLLQVKDRPTYAPNKSGNTKVIIKNIKGMEISGNKASQKIYYKHAGRLGHLKKKTYAESFKKDPEWVIKHAVRLMLPKNRLAKERLSHLIIKKENG